MISLAGVQTTIKVLGHQHQCLAGGYDLELGNFLKVASMVVTWWIVAFLHCVYSFWQVHKIRHFSFNIMYLGACDGYLLVLLIITIYHITVQLLWLYVFNDSFCIHLTITKPSDYNSDITA